MTNIDNNTKTITKNHELIVRLSRENYQCEKCLNSLFKVGDPKS